jgi:hypothetical protein
MRASLGAIQRQAKLMGMRPTQYLEQALAAVISGNEAVTVVTEKGELGWFA